MLKLAHGAGSHVIYKIKAEKVAKMGVPLDPKDCVVYVKHINTLFFTFQIFNKKLHSFHLFNEILVGNC